MKIAVGFDHAGYAIKKTILEVLQSNGHEVIDFGTNDETPVDYPDYAAAVAGAVQSGRAERGIVVCGSGVGACIAANKFKGIRAGICHDTYSAHQGVEHDDMNVLCLGARIIGIELAAEITKTFLSAKFTSEKRHLRRLQKVLEIERQQNN